MAKNDRRRRRRRSSPADLEHGSMRRSSSESCRLSGGRSHITQVPSAPKPPRRAGQTTLEGSCSVCGRLRKVPYIHWRCHLLKHSTRQPRASGGIRRDWRKALGGHLPTMPQTATHCTGGYARVTAGPIPERASEVKGLLVTSIGSLGELVAYPPRQTPQGPLLGGSEWVEGIGSRTWLPPRRPSSPDARVRVLGIIPIAPACT